MILESLEVGPVLTNCYLVGCPETKEGLLIDPGGDAERILKKVRRSGLAVRQVVNTHGHGDHIAANAAVKRALGCRILVHEADADTITSREASLLEWVSGAEVSPPADRRLVEGDTVGVGTLSFRVLHLPGHTPGGLGLLGEGVLFTGDTLFAGSVGRTDLPGGSDEALRETLAKKIAPLDDGLALYPGHGASTTLAREKERNPFLREAMESS